MLFSKIEAHESDFNLTKKDAQGDEYDFTIDNSRGFPLAFLKPKSGISGYFYPEESAKEMIVLHFTCGFLKGDIATLVEQDSHMSVHFVIGRNGIAYQLFSSANWSYHLGKGAIGGNTPNSKRSIAIELSNIGPLTPKENSLLDIYGNPYCTLEETDAFTRLAEPFRGYSYFATFTGSQYTTLKSLLAHLSKKWSIPLSLLPEPKRYDVFGNDATTYRGICTHANYRADGKTDFGPAFNWTTIV